MREESECVARKGFKTETWVAKGDANSETKTLSEKERK